MIYINYQYFQIENSENNENNENTDLHPSGRSDKRPAVVPLGSDRILAGTTAEEFEPQVEALLVDAETDQTAEFNIHLSFGSVVRDVDHLHRAKQ